MSNHQATTTPPRPVDATSSAWLVLIAFFLLFCVLVAGACYGGWRYYADAMTRASNAIVRVHAPAGVSYQARGSVLRAAPSKPCAAAPVSELCQALGEEDRVLAVPQAGYGPVASLLLPDGSHFQLWAYPTGADLTLTRYRVSRWSQRRQEVELAQHTGYVRYDIPAESALPYSERSYTVAISQSIQIIMAAGGSYSIDVPQPNAQHPRRSTAAGTLLLAELAVRSGSAEVRSAAGSQVVQPGQKVQIDLLGLPGPPEPAEWNLIRDGDFVQLESGLATKDLNAWQPKHHDFDGTVSDTEKNAQITVHRECKPHKPAFCTRDETTYIAQLQREGGQTKSFGIGIEQRLDLDISEYHALNLTLSARIINQSVPQAGVVGLECPVTIRLRFKQNSIGDRDEERSICFYRNTTGVPIPSANNFIYQAATDQPLWYDLSFDLRDPKLNLLGSARYLESIYIYANGHDYIAQITDIALIARQQR